MNTSPEHHSPPGATSAIDTTSSTRHGLLYVGIAVLLFGTSPIFVRWSQPFTAIEIAFWRLAIATLLVALVGLAVRQSLLLRAHELPRFLGYGLITALHFVFYIAALNFTTIAHALAFTYTSPVFVALLSALYLREPLPLRKIIGVCIAIAGVAAMAGFEPHYTTCNLPGSCIILGDGLALLSALCYAVYSIVGRREREQHPLFRYTMNIYGLAALWLLLPALFFAFQHAYPLPALAAVAALGIFPLGLGHTLYNAAIRNVHATYANLIATQEVTVGVLLGIIFLQDIPSITTLIGGLVTMIGIISVLL